MTIQTMRLTDYDALFDLWTSIPNMGLRSLDDSREGLAAFLKRNPATCFAAYSDGQLVGAILCGHDGRRGYIYHTVVREEYRNQGIASKMIDAAVSVLKKEGITRICLNVMESNEIGKRFWENRGWARKDFLGFYSKSITDKKNIPLS